MLTFLKQIFIWWNQQTLATRIQTIFFGKFVGVDNFGNKYYESKYTITKTLIANNICIIFILLFIM